MSHDFMMGMITKGGRYIVGATIKSIQSGTILLEGTDTIDTATISAVDLNKTFVVPLGVSKGGGSGTVHWNHALCYLELINSTTVRATRATATSTFDPLVSFMVVEFDSGINLIQRGVNAGTAQGDTDISVTGVDIDKALLIASGWPGEEDTNNIPSIKVKDATTLTLTCNYPHYALCRVGWELIEFE